MAAVAVEEQLGSLRDLIAVLEREHRAFASDVAGLEAEARVGRGADALRGLFIPLRDTLTNHMLTEEFEIYPALMQAGRFDSSISYVMQQHHDVSSCLGKMELSLRLSNFHEFGAALDELSEVLHEHQTAEEEKVFPQVPC